MSRFLWKDKHEFNFRFKHNTSFVSRFSTIRKHRSQGMPSQTSLARGRTDSTVYTDIVGTSSKTPSCGTGSNFVDEGAGKDVSDTSKRNSDGKDIDDFDHVKFYALFIQ